jgi:SpoVK/Ycf46/Vps4 family AAA+-type ATPase
LKDNKVTGAILYGPPGTGKTLLARGVAKESGFNMLSISTSELWQKCHGEDEKMIKAVFSMARKMYPSIVFLDEADAMLGERKAGERRHLRAMVNQFLMEWDGITSGTDSPFILLATNRPNDLDPAVLRRAPVRINFPLPGAKERLGILRLLLKNETLGPDITLPTLVNLTPQYTGSDLKNLCVTAATECVDEQLEDTASRILTRRHFLAAMQTVKATAISKTREQDMQSFQSKQGEQAEE